LQEAQIIASAKTDKILIILPARSPHTAILHSTIAHTSNEPKNGGSALDCWRC